MKRSHLRRVAAVCLLAAIWIGAPDAVAADNCSDWTVSEVASCPAYFQWKAIAMLAGAIFSVVGALRALRSSAPPDDTPAKPAPPPDQRLSPGPNRYTQNAAYDPGGINQHGGAGSSGLD